MSPSTEPLQGAELDYLRQASGYGARQWLTATGLVAAVSDLRRRETDTDRAPLPGIPELLDEITETYSDVMNALDTEILKAEWAAPITERDRGGRFAPGRRSDRDRAADAEVPARLLDLGVAVVRCDRRARQIAQLVLGATSESAGTDDVARVERAAVELLAPGGGPPWTLMDDGLELFSTTREGLGIEIAGIICRLLVDWGGAVQLRSAEGAGIELSVDGDALDLVALGAADPGRDGEIWEPDGTGRWQRRWESPVTVLEPATEAVRVLFDVVRIETPLELAIVLRDR